MERGCAYSLHDQARVVIAMCLLYNVVRTCEAEEFGIGPIVPSNTDLDAGRILEQDDLSAMDAEPDDDGDAELHPAGAPGGTNARAARNRERKDLEESQLRRADAMWEAVQVQARRNLS